MTLGSGAEAAQHGPGGDLTSSEATRDSACPAFPFRSLEAQRGQVRGWAWLGLERGTQWPRNEVDVRFRPGHPVLELLFNVLLATVSNSLGIRM